MKINKVSNNNIFKSKHGKMILVTFASYDDKKKESRELGRLIKSAQSFGVEPVKLRKHPERPLLFSYMKIEPIMDILDDPSWDCMLAVDGNDTFMTGHPREAAEFDPDYLWFGCEFYSSPHDSREFARQFPANPILSQHEFKYLNAGLMFGTREKISKVWSKYPIHEETHDQLGQQKIMLTTSHIKLDYASKHLLNMAGRRTDCISIIDGRPVFTPTKSKPCVIHSSGPGKMFQLPDIEGAMKANVSGILKKDMIYKRRVFGDKLKMRIDQRSYQALYDDEYLLDFIKTRLRKNPKVLIDIGARFGSFLCGWIYSIGKPELIRAYEPYGPSASLCKDNLKRFGMDNSNVYSSPVLHKNVMVDIINADSEDDGSNFARICQHGSVCSISIEKAIEGCKDIHLNISAMGSEWRIVRSIGGSMWDRISSISIQVHANMAHKNFDAPEGVNYSNAMQKMAEFIPSNFTKHTADTSWNKTLLAVR